MLRVSSGFISEWDGCDLINQRKRQWKTSKKQKCIERNNGSVSSGVHNSDLWMCAAANTPYRYGDLRCALIRSWLCLPHTKIAEKNPKSHDGTARLFISLLFMDECLAKWFQAHICICFADITPTRMCMCVCLIEICVAFWLNWNELIYVPE